MSWMVIVCHQHQVNLLLWLIISMLTTGRLTPLWNGMGSISHLITGLSELQRALWSACSPVAISLISCGPFFAVLWWWWSHTHQVLALVISLEDFTPLHTCIHTFVHSHSPLKSSVCQPVLWWLSSTTKLSLLLASPKPPAELWFSQSKWDWIQNSHWARNFWNITQFREVKFREENVFTLLGHRYWSWILTSFLASV